LIFLRDTKGRGDILGLAYLRKSEIFLLVIIKDLARNQPVSELIKRTSFCFGYYNGTPVLLNTRGISFLKPHDIS
jgi:hypothetical protein